MLTCGVLMRDAFEVLQDGGEITEDIIAGMVRLRDSIGLIGSGEVPG